MRNPGVTPPAEGAARADAALAEPPRAVAAQVGQSLTLGSTAAQLQKNAAAAAADPGVSERGLAYSTISFGLTQHHPLRLFTIRLVENAWFDRVVLVFILANCLTIAISGPGANSPTDNALEILFTSVFTAEILLRALAYGLVQTKNSYLRDRWHWLDIVVVVTSWISISVADSSTNYGALRTFRVLRPLRTVNSVRGMRVLVLSMLRSIPKLLDVAIVAVFVALVFAILGVQSFKGALHYRCVPDDSPLLNAALSNDDLVRQLGESASDRAVCDPLRASSCAFEGHACVYFEQNPNYGLTSFDDVWHASLVIFISSTLEGWSDIMYMAGAGADEWLSVVYFLLLIVLGSFFVVNLFLAVIFESFQEATAEDKRAVREQKDAELHAAKLRRLTRSSSSGSTMAVGSAAASGVGGVGAAAGGHGSPLRREGSCSALEAGSQSSSSLLSSEEEEKLTEEEARAALYAADGGDDEKDAPAHMGQCRIPALVAVVECTWCLHAFSLAIFVNALLMALDGYGVPQATQAALERGNQAFTAIFTVEIALKLAAYGPLAALRVPWNLADLLVVIISWVELILNFEKVEGGLGFQLTVFRTFRLLRLVRLARALPGLQRVLRMVNRSFENIVYLTFFFVLIMFIAALLGQELFYYHFKPTDGTQFNFASFEWALLTIFVVLSGENWNSIMYSGAGSVPDGMRWQVVCFFLIVVVIGRFFVLNLFIAVLLSNVGEVKDQKKAAERALKASTVGKLSLLISQKNVSAEHLPLRALVAGQQLSNSSILALHLLGLDGDSVRALEEEHLEQLGRHPLPVWERPGGLHAVAFEDVKAHVAEQGMARETAASELLPANRRRMRLFRGDSNEGGPLDVRRSRGIFGFGLGRQGRRRKDSGGSIDSSQNRHPELVSVAAQPSSSALPTIDELVGQQGGMKGGLPVPKGTDGAKAMDGAKGALDDSTSNACSPHRLELAASLVLPSAAATAAAGSGESSSGAGSSSSSSSFLSELALLPKAALAYIAQPAQPQPQQPGAAQFGQVGGVGQAGASRPPRFLSGGKAHAHLSSVRQESRTISNLNIFTSRDSRRIKTAMSRAQLASMRVKRFLQGRDLSFGCLPPTNALRAGALRIVKHRLFDQGVLLLIVLSSVALALDTPGPASGRLGWVEDGRPALSVLEWLFTALFFCEMLVKMLALGVLRTPEAYFKSRWNLLDFCLVVAAVTARIVEQLLESPNPPAFAPGPLAMLSTMRLLRVLRPLRMLTHNEGLQLVVNSLLRCFPEVLNVLLIFALFLSVFAILGVQLFAGKLSSCSDPLVLTKAACIGSFYDADLERVAGRVWVNNHLGSFDTFLDAAALLFEMSTEEQWPDVMLLGIGAQGVDIAPETDVRNAPRDQMATAAFFIAWILVGAFFIINLFVGVVIDNFNELKEAQDGSGLLTDGQKAWSNSLSEVVKLRALHLSTPPRQVWRRGVFELVIRTEFEVTMMALVLINICFMASDYFAATEAHVQTLALANYSFTALFTVELLLKVVGFGPRGYLRDWWNDFDAFLVAVSWLDLLISEILFAGGAASGFSPMLLRTLRVARIARMLRLVRSLRSIRNLLATLIYALPALANVGGLLLLLLFIYAVLGVHLFYNIPQQDYINQFANFTDFGHSFWLLFRAMTGESWNGLMRDTMVQEDARAICSEAEGTCTLSPFISVLYFYSFVVLTLVCLNLVIAVILEKKAAMSNENTLTTQELEHFQQVWSDFDRKGTYTMPAVHLAELLWNLDAPLGLGARQHMRRVDVLRFLDALALPEHSGLVHMHEALLALARRAHGAELPKSIFTTALNGNIESALRARGVSRLAPARLSVAQVFAAQLLQRRWRQARLRRIFENLTEESRSNRQRMRFRFRSPFGGKKDSRNKLARSQQRSLKDLIGEEGPRLLHIPPAAVVSLPPSSRAGLIAKVRAVDGSIVAAEWISAETVERAAELLRTDARAAKANKGGQRLNLGLSFGALKFPFGRAESAEKESNAPLPPSRAASLPVEQMPLPAPLGTLTADYGPRELSDVLAVALMLNRIDAGGVAEGLELETQATGSFIALLAKGRMPTVAETFAQAVTPEYYSRGDLRLARGVKSVTRAFGWAVVQKIDEQQRWAQRQLHELVELVCCCMRRPQMAAELSEAEAKVALAVVVLAAGAEAPPSPTPRERYAAAELARKRAEAEAGRGSWYSYMPWASPPEPVARRPTRAAEEKDF